MLVYKNLLLFFIVVITLIGKEGFSQTEKDNKISKSEYIQGKAALNKSDYAEASKHFLFAYTEYFKVNDYGKITSCLYYLSFSEFNREHFQESENFLTKLVDVVNKHNIETVEAHEGQYLYSNILLNENKVDKAYSFLKNLLFDKNEKKYADSTKAKLYHQIGTVEYYKGDFFSAQKSYELSQKFGQAAFGRNSLFVSDQVNNLGVINFMLGRDNEALMNYRISESILKNSNKKNNLALASNYVNISLIFRNKNDFTNALLFLEKAKELYLAERTTSNKVIVNIYQNLAVVYSKLNNTGKQYENIKKAMSFCEKNHVNNIVKVYFQYAIYLEGKNDLKGARLYFEKAVIESEKFFGKSPDLAYAYGNLGEFLLNHNQELDKAYLLFKKSLDFFKSTSGLKNISISNCFEHIGNYNLKKGNLKQALTDFHNALLSVSEDFLDNDIYSYPFHTKSLSKIQSLEILKDKADVLLRMAECSSGDKKVFYLINAFRHYKQAVKFICEIRSEYSNEENRFNLSDNEFSTYLKAINTAYNLYKLTQSSYYLQSAYSLADNYQSSSLQLMIQQKSNDKVQSNIPLLKTDYELKREIAMYNNWILQEKNAKVPDLNKIQFWKNKILSLTIKQEENLTEINQLHPAYRVINSKYANPGAIHQLMKKIKNNEAVIEYFLSDSVLFSFCITKYQTYLIKRKITTDFFNKINDIILFTKTPPFSNTDSNLFINYRKAGYDLYEYLLAPFSKIIHNKSLIIVPHRELTYLPFCTLLTKESLNNTINYKELPYLLKENPIRYLYASGLLGIWNNTSTTGQMLAFAPDYSSRSFKSDKKSLDNLLYNKTEIKNALKYFPGKQITNLEASEDNFKNLVSDYRIVHLAMHSIIDDNNPLNSCLIFAPNTSTQNDDRLYSYETYNLSINADLLVLSACNSGAGKLLKGEGMYSITRGFIFAGAKSVLVSYWDVDDQTGSEISSIFYKNLTLNKTKDLALQESKIEYINKSDILHAHPYYWANYLLIGEAEPIRSHNNKGWYLLGFICIIVLLLSGFCMSKKK